MRTTGNYLKRWKRLKAETVGISIQKEYVLRDHGGVLETSDEDTDLIR